MTSLLGAFIAVGGIIWSAGQLTAEMQSMGKRLDLAVENLEEKLDGDISAAMVRAQVMRQELMSRIERDALREDESRKLLVLKVLDSQSRLSWLEGENAERKRWENKYTWKN